MKKPLFIFVGVVVWGMGAIGTYSALHDINPDGRDSMAHIGLALTWPLWVSGPVAYRIVKG